jgi:predicted transcriptional regulator
MSKDGLRGADGTLDVEREAAPIPHPAPRPVLLSFHSETAAGIATGTIPWEFRRRRSGHEPGARVLMYSSAPVRAFSGAYTAGTVFAYDSLAALKEGVHASEMARFGHDGIDERWLEHIFAHLPVGHAFEVCEPRAFEPPIPLGPQVDGSPTKPPQGFQYLDLSRPEHAALWKAVQAQEGSEGDGGGCDVPWERAFDVVASSQAAWIEERFGTEASRMANYGWNISPERLTTKVYGHGVLSTGLAAPDEHQFEPGRAV